MTPELNQMIQDPRFWILLGFMLLGAAVPIVGMESYRAGLSKGSKQKRNSKGQFMRNSKSKQLRGDKD